MKHVVIMSRVIHRFGPNLESGCTVVYMSQNDIKIPRHSHHSKVEKALATTPWDGEWHQLLEMGPSSAEQTARAYNVDGASWILGYTNTEDGSILWAKRIV